MECSTCCVGQINQNVRIPKMKPTLTLLILSLCLRAFAQTAATPLVDTNAIANARAAVAAIQATNTPVVVPMVTNAIQTFPMFYPVGIPHGANMMTSTDNVHWCVGQYFDITKSNLLSFTNPANSTNFWMIMLTPPQLISISNSFTPTNSATNSTPSTK